MFTVKLCRSGGGYLQPFHRGDTKIGPLRFVVGKVKLAQYFSLSILVFCS